MVGMRKTIPIALILAACGGDAVDVAATVLEDAGKALTDAAAAISDAGTPDAAADTDSGASDSATALPAARVLKAACDLRHDRGAVGVEYWAALEVERADVVGVWTCDHTHPGDAGDWAPIPVPECGAQANAYHASGVLYVNCGIDNGGGHWKRVEVVAR